MVKLNQKSLVVSLLVLLVLALGYIVFDKYMEYREQEKMEVYQLGVQFGYEQAVVQMMQQLATCQQVPLRYENSTINAVAVECLQQTPQTQTETSSTLN